MILFQTCGAPGSGKTVAAMGLCLAFKKEGWHAELVGETARESHIYKGTTCTLQDNQFAVAGEQWERVVRLARYGVEIAVSDSPLIQGLLYSEHLPYYDELEALIRKCEDEFDTYNVYVRRAFPYRAGERLQTEAEADKLVLKARELIGDFWLEIDGNEQGNAILNDSALNLAGELKQKDLI